MTNSQSVLMVYKLWIHDTRILLFIYLNAKQDSLYLFYLDNVNSLLCLKGSKENVSFLYTAERKENIMLLFDIIVDESV